MYLGLPFGDKPRSKSLWGPVVANFDWKRQHLSLDGRITLIKVCYVSLPGQRMSTKVKQVSDEKKNLVFPGFIFYQEIICLCRVN